jgi:hypothetical protein
MCMLTVCVLYVYYHSMGVYLLMLLLVLTCACFEQTFCINHIYYIMHTSDSLRPAVYRVHTYVHAHTYVYIMYQATEFGVRKNKSALMNRHYDIHVQNESSLRRISNSKSVVWIQNQSFGFKMNRQSMAQIQKDSHQLQILLLSNKTHMLD